MALLAVVRVVEADRETLRSSILINVSSGAPSTLVTAWDVARGVPICVGSNSAITAVSLSASLIKVVNVGYLLVKRGRVFQYFNETISGPFFERSLGLDDDTITVLRRLQIIFSNNDVCSKSPFTLA